jgi:hypothetical protein
MCTLAARLLARQRRRLNTLVVAASVWSLLPGHALAQDAPARRASELADSLGWMAGCWQQRGPSSVIDELWMPPSGGMLLGASRTVRNGQVVDYEFASITASDGRLAYTARPVRQAVTTFTGTLDANGGVTFENASHDFPQRIRYRPVGTDSLHARIEGTMQGTQRGIDYRFARVACSSRGR